MDMAEFIVGGLFQPAVAQRIATNSYGCLIDSHIFIDKHSHTTHIDTHHYAHAIANIHAGTSGLPETA